jgi:hypothetical protein
LLGLNELTLFFFTGAGAAVLLLVAMFFLW